MTNANKVIIQATKAGQFFITLPRAIADFKGWHKGTRLAMSEDRHGEVILKEVTD